MKADGWFIDKCVGLAVGESANPVHRYGDGWYVLWDNPRPDDLGRFCKTADELRRTMSGSRIAGRRIDLKFLGRT